MQAYKWLDAATNNWTAISIDDYKEAISYDPNGNILTYNRNGSPSIGTNQRLMDSLLYQYYYFDPTNNRKSYDPLQGLPGDVGRLTNQLAHVDDRMVNSAAYSQDLDDQVVNNYSYDAIGNLKGDAAEGISAINWNVYGKITSIVKNGSTISYSYDASGNRISKTVGGITTIYVRDASGNVMSVYQGTSTTLKQTETHLYGSGRLGIQGEQTVMPVAVPLQGGYGSASVSVFTRGEKSFELSNHVGNVLVTISDKKIGVDNNADGLIDYYNAEVMTASDLYPFGMSMAGRSFQQGISSYRYSINGQEKETDLNENITTAEYWEYDSRIGRRWNRDVISKPSVSDYATFGNNPIYFVDPNGADWYKDTKGKNKGDVVFMEGSEKHKGYKNITGEWTKRNSRGFSYLYGHGKEDITQSGSNDLLSEVVIKATRKTSLADRTGALNWANYDKSAFKKWQTGLWDYSRMRGLGASSQVAGAPFGDLGLTYEGYYQAEQDYRNMQLAVVGIMASPLALSVAPEAIAATMTTRLVSVGGDAAVQYAFNISEHGFLSDNFAHMNITSLAGSFVAPNGAFMSSFIGNGFGYTRANGYSGINANTNNINTFSNIAIGFGANKIGNHYNSLLKNPSSITSQFKANLMGNFHGNGAQGIKDFYIKLNSK